MKFMGSYGNGIIGALYSGFKFFFPHCCFAADLQQQSLPPLLSVGAAEIMEPDCSSSPTGCSSSGCSSSGESSKAQAVSFTVGFSEPAKNPKKMPKRIAATRNKRRQELSEATIEEKQKLAEKRRKVSWFCRPSILTS